MKRYRLYHAPDLDGTEDEDPLLWIDDYYVVRVTYLEV